VSSMSSAAGPLHGVSRIHLNLVPIRVIAETDMSDLLHIELEVTDLPEECLANIVAKLVKSPSIVDAQWHGT
jgi:hypothetical protein